jgi:hypothetical protein
VQISTSDRKANVADAFGFGEARVAAARTRILKVLADAPEVDLAVARSVGPIVAAAAVAAAPDAPPSRAWLGILIPVLALVVMGQVFWGIFRWKSSRSRGARGGSHGGSTSPYASSDTSSSPYASPDTSSYASYASSDTSSSSFGSGASGGGGSNDSGGGGGESGGGGASDSW